jgi:nifR3 family TIM-barrel protein
VFKIGSIQIDVPFVQAALSGYSDYPMRRLARRYGATYTLSEARLDRLIIQPGRKRKQILDVPQDDHPVGAQLLGAEPDEVARAAGTLAEAGFDVIDINFGCPVRKVLGRHRGGFLLSEPDRALSIVRSVFQVVGSTHPVTVKMRRGTDDSPQARQDFFGILDGAFEAGVSAITVHPRTVKQRYVGPSDWSFFAQVKEYAKDRVILGSGDLFSAEACLRMLRQTGVDGVTLARGCIGNPWIFEECTALWRGEPLPPPPSMTRQAEAIRGHYADLVDHYGPDRAAKIIRRFGIKYSEHHPVARSVRDAFIAVRRPDDVERVIGHWYDAGADWPPVIRRDRHGDLVAAGARP